MDVPGPRNTLQFLSHLYCRIRERIVGPCREFGKQKFIYPQKEAPLQKSQWAQQQFLLRCLVRNIKSTVRVHTVHESQSNWRHLPFSFNTYIYSLLCEHSLVWISFEPRTIRGPWFLKAWIKTSISPSFNCFSRYYRRSS